MNGNMFLSKIEAHIFEYIYADYSWSVIAPNQIIHHNWTKTQMMILLLKIPSDN